LNSHDDTDAFMRNHADRGTAADLGSVLVVDIGNTRTVIGWFAQDELAWTDHWPTYRDERADPLPVIIQSMITTKGVVLANLSALVIASVVPTATQKLVDALAGFCPLLPILVSAQTAGIQILVDYPERVGADRIANAVAASLYPARVGHGHGHRHDFDGCRR
jgi:type III pantothenate kinase